MCRNLQFNIFIFVFISISVFRYKTSLSLLSQLTAVMLAKVLVLRGPDEWLCFRVSLTPCLSLSHWFRTTYSQLLLESISEWKHKYLLQCFEMYDGGAELMVLVLPAGAACWCCWYWCLAKCAMIAAD